MTLNFLDRVLYARKGGEDPTSKTTDLGGDNITVEDAIVSYDGEETLKASMNIILETKVSVLGRA